MWWYLARSIDDVVAGGLRDPALLVRDAFAIAFSYTVARYAFSASVRAVMTGWAVLGTSVMIFAEMAFTQFRSNVYRADAAGAVGSAFVTALLPAFVVSGYVALLVTTVGKHIEAKAIESGDRALLAAALWILAGLVPVFLVKFAFFAIGIGGSPASSADWAEAPFPFACVALAPPVAVIVSALVRIRARRRWLAGVRAGSVPGWRVVEGARDEETLPHLAPIGEAGACTLVRVHDAAQPFRGSETLEPIALVRAAAADELR
jgi:hypothetical protein